MTTVLEGARGQRHAPAALYPLERTGTRSTVGLVGPRVGLDRCGKSRPHRDSIARSSRGITQKKAYKIQNTAKILNQERVFFCLVYKYPNLFSSKLKVVGANVGDFEANHFT